MIDFTSSEEQISVSELRQRFGGRPTVCADRSIAQAATA